MDDEDVATSSKPVRWSGGPVRFFPSSRDKLGTSPDNVGRKTARPGRFWPSTRATCTGKGNLFFNVRVCTVPCTKVQGNKTGLHHVGRYPDLKARELTYFPTENPFVPNSGAIVIPSIALGCHPSATAALQRTCCHPPRAQGGQDAPGGRLSDGPLRFADTWP